MAAGLPPPALPSLYASCVSAAGSKFTFLGAINEGAGKIDVAAVVKLFALFAPVAFVVFAEHIADHKNLGSIIDRDLIKDPGLPRTLLGDGVANQLSRSC